jgi:GTP-binding protein
LGWKEQFYLISAVNRAGVKALCWDVMSFINAHPKEAPVEEVAADKVEFKWDDYHREQLEEVAAADVEDDDDDDWDEDDEQGIETIYHR